MPTPIDTSASTSAFESGPFLQVDVLYGFLGLEPYFLLGLLSLSCWMFYRFFLKDLSVERHRSLQSHFGALGRHFLILSLFFVIFILSHEASTSIPALERLAPYFGFFAFLWGIILFVKTCRLWVLQYLFLQSTREGVPLLIVNVFSLLVSIAIGFWAVSRLFGLQLGPLLATSAAFSIVLGLALQDTLGNLFAGIALQFDKNFEIGDWVEVTQGIQKAVGQVKEISWRSVVLVGLSDELITLPNRFMAMAQIANFSPPDQPIVRSQVFRLPFNAPIEQAIQLLETVAVQISEIRGLPAPHAYASDSTDSWVSVKLIYFIDSYGSQHVAGDKVLRKGIDILSQHGIDLARTEYHYRQVGVPPDVRT